MGVSYASLGRHSEAIECYQLAVGLDPNLAQCYNNMSFSLNALGRYP